MSTDPIPSEHPALIDIHSHLLPGVDDGCADFDESLICVRRLRQAGFVGTMCTPHVWPDAYPFNTQTHIEARTQQLQQQLHEAGINDYQLWPGGELRLFDGVIDFVKEHGVPTLAESNYVLSDFWSDTWPKWVDKSFDWLIQQGYQPILAHPERLGCHKQLDKGLRRLLDMGVIMQGNYRSMTGEEGYHADHIVRNLLSAGHVTFMALDMHGPDTLESRFDGITLLESEYGKAALDRMTSQAPRELILNQSGAVR